MQNDVGIKDTVSEPATSTLVYHFSIGTLLFVFCSGSTATEYETAHAYRLGAFQLVERTA